MSAPKFTPGPWSYTDESLNTPNEPFWIGADHPEVGRCTHAAVRSGCEEADELGSMEANARLIALAPELYEYVESSAQNGCATAQALIAKAGGSHD